MTGPLDLPRVLIAAPASGHGKTTIASGLMAAMHASGRDVAPFKVGPDYIDPGYHRLATGRPGRNLDPVMCREDHIAPLLAHGTNGAEVSVIEGVMGLFDGRLDTEGFGSSAHVAHLTRSPIVLTVDVSHTSRTVAAWVHGLATFDPDLHVAGVVLNKAATVRHADEAVRAVEATGIPVFGVLPRDEAIHVPSRHLGLVPVAERAEADAAMSRLAEQLRAEVDVDAIAAVAAAAEPLDTTPWNPHEEVTPVRGRPRVAIAGGRAFTFRYAEVSELLDAAGCEVVEFDPLTDSALPDGIAGLYLGGGFPEVHATELAANTAMVDDLSRRIDAGLPTVAECAGMLYLAEALEGHAMVGAIPASAQMGPRLTLGYRDAVSPVDTLLTRAGDRVTGHEFHRTVMTPGHTGTGTWRHGGTGHGFSLAPTGTPSVHASYLHTHWAGHPVMAQNFAAACARWLEEGGM